MSRKWQRALPFVALFASLLAVLALYDRRNRTRTAKLVNDIIDVRSLYGGSWMGNA